MYLEVKKHVDNLSCKPQYRVTPNDLNLAATDLWYCLLLMHTDWLIDTVDI